MKHKKTLGRSLDSPLKATGTRETTETGHAGPRDSAPQTASRAGASASWSPPKRAREKEATNTKAQGAGA